MPWRFLQAQSSRRRISCERKRFHEQDDFLLVVFFAHAALSWRAVLAREQVGALRRAIQYLLT